ncbi:arsenate reductase ArsC [Liberiplasma polymorphum]|uniref:arsenate reductase ArsC n=1 Tax=Liberiplasma polymorphum TaxID=3374570 RepID=UPI003773E6BF
MIKVAFMCIHNSCRSQMAEGYLRTLGKDLFEVYSAGTEDYPEVKPLAIEAMKLDGVDISKQYPKKLDVLPNMLDLLVTMGCGVECPFVPTKSREDWGLDDPSGGPIEDYIVTRDLIKERVLELIQRFK